MLGMVETGLPIGCLNRLLIVAVAAIIVLRFF